MTNLFSDLPARFVNTGESTHNQCMNVDEFVELRRDDLVECAGVEHRVLQNHGHAVSLSAKRGKLTVPRAQAESLTLLRRADGPSLKLDAEWGAVNLHLRLVNLVRARIGQRPLHRDSGYTPSDVKADAAFYVETQTWARQRALEFGIA